MKFPGWVGILLLMLWSAVAGGRAVQAGQDAAVNVARPKNTASSGWPEDSVAVRGALARFLVAFENLDWPAFRANFGDGVTAFFPSPEPPERVEGRAAVEAGFGRVFDTIRRSAAVGAPPYQQLHPEDIVLQRLGADAVLVSFHLRNSERLARRTMIFAREGGTWRIIHLHASNVPRP